MNWTRLAFREPQFWWDPSARRSAALLRPFSHVVGSIAHRRLAKQGEQVAVPVICVGNPTVGGAGKTPVALAIAEMLITSGVRPFFLSRGYGGSERGPCLVDATKDQARDVGDEPLLLARTAPTIVARDRLSGARMAVTAGAQAVIMDDGFQNPSLHKDLSFLVIDGGRGVGNGKVIPAGPLRAPLEAQLPHAQALIIVGGGERGEEIAAAANRQGIPSLRASLELDQASVVALRGKRLLAFAGIGNPAKFFTSLHDEGLDIAERHAFADHHVYSPRDIKTLLTLADANTLTAVTTEKDWVRIATAPTIAPAAARTTAVPVKLVFKQPGEVAGLIAVHCGLNLAPRTAGAP